MSDRHTVDGHPRPKDSGGWPLHVGQRLVRYSKAGHDLGQWMLGAFEFGDDRYPEGILHIECLTSGGQGVTIPERVRILRTPEGETAPKSVLIWRDRRRAQADAAERAMRRRAPKLVTRKS